jgi:hypothetical protein
MMKSRRMGMAGHLAFMGEKKRVYRLLVGRPRYRWKHSFKINLREIGYGGMDWIHLILDRDL